MLGLELRQVNEGYAFRVGKWQVGFLLFGLLAIRKRCRIPHWRYRRQGSSESGFLA
jgi:hypothetical protein